MLDSDWHLSDNQVIMFWIFIRSAIFYYVTEQTYDFSFMTYRVGFTYFWQSIHISDIIISFSIEKLYVVGFCTLSKISHCNPTLLQDNVFLFLVVSSLRVFILFSTIHAISAIWTFCKNILGHVRKFSHVRTLSFST